MTQKPQGQFIFSITDIIRSLKRYRVMILLTVSVFGLCTFFFLALRPIQYTANGILKGHVSQASHPLARALDFLSKEESAFASNEQLALLRSYPVLQELVLRLNLQGYLTKPKRGKKIYDFIRTLKAEYLLHKFKKNRFPAHVSSSQVIVPDSVPFTEKSPPLQCCALHFREPCALKLKIYFLNSSTFQVFKGRKELGKGRLDEPFRLREDDFFKLTGQAKKGELFLLYLSPLDTTIEALQKTLKVQKNKENSTFIEVSFTHQNSQLAAHIVNGAMNLFQDFLTQEGKRKIESQLDYLKMRQGQAMEQLDLLLQGQMQQIEEDLKSGFILTSENELAFMAKNQEEKKRALLQTADSMESLAHILELPCSSFIDLIEHLKSTKKDTLLQALTVDGAYELLQGYQHQLDNALLTINRLKYCEQALLDASIDCASVFKTLQDDTLNNRFDNMHQLNSKLADEKHWSEKEKNLLKEELETEKRFLLQHLVSLKEACFIEENSLKSRIHALQHNLLYLLFKQYEQTQNALDELALIAKHFPQKWKNSQRVQIYSKLYGDMMESISKLVETKNIGYNIDYYISNILKYATPPLLPNSPHVLAGTLVSCFVALVLTILVLVLHQAWAWPIASCETLSALGKTVLSKTEHLAYFLSQKGRISLLLSNEGVALGSTLAQLWKKEGKCVCIQQPIETERLTDIFFKFLREQKEVDIPILIILPKGLDSIEMGIWEGHVDTLVYEVGQERLKELSKLPKKTLFLVREKKLEPLTLQEIVPLLAHKMKALIRT